MKKKETKIVKENRIEKIRILKGFTRKQLSDKIKITQSRLRNWEKNKTFIPLDYWNIICKIFDCDSNYLYEYKDMEGKKHAK